MYKGQVRCWRPLAYGKYGVIVAIVPAVVVTVPSITKFADVTAVVIVVSCAAVTSAVRVVAVVTVVVPAPFADTVKLPPVVLAIMTAV